MAVAAAQAPLLGGIPYDSAGWCVCVCCSASPDVLGLLFVVVLLFVRPVMVPHMDCERGIFVWL